MILLGLSLLPCVAILWWLFSSDRHPEPPRVVAITVLLGGLSTIPIVIVELLVQRTLGLPDQPLTIIHAVALSFLVAALVEECFKFAVLRSYSMTHDSFDEPFDGVVYGAAASLGFAAAENVLYVFAQESSAASLGVAILRALTAVPLHAICGILMGSCLGIAHFSRSSRLGWTLLGVIGAIGIHGLYDSFVFGSDVFAMHNLAGLALVSIGGMMATVLFGCVVCLLAIARMRRDQVERWAAQHALQPIPAEASSLLLPLAPPPPDPAEGTPHASTAPPPPPDSMAPMAHRVAMPDAEAMTSVPGSLSAGPPALPMVSMVLQALATGSAIAFLLVAAIWADDRGGAAAMVACGMLGISAVLSLIGCVTSTIALVRRDPWTVASVMSLITGVAMLGLIVVLIAVRLANAG